MAERRVDRTEWAAIVTDLLQRESNGNKSAFARLVGVKAGITVDRWQKGTVEVTDENVRAVARAVGMNPVDLLVRVGYYDADEVNQVPSPQLTAADERAIQIIENSDASPALKRKLVKHVHDMRTEHERLRAAEVERMLDVAGAKPRKTT